MLMDGTSPMVEAWKNGSDDAIPREREPSRLWKETRTSGSQPRSSSQTAHSRGTSLQSGQRPEMTVYPSGRQAVDQLRNMEIADPSGLLQPHELEACMPTELDGATTMPKAGPAPWTGRLLNSETNSPSFMRKASLRTRRAEKQSRESGFFVPRPSSLGMRRLDRTEVDAELAAVRASDEEARPVNPSPASVATATVSPMNTAALKPSSNVNTPLRSAVSHDSMELDAESPRRRASFSSWRQTTFDVVAPAAHNPRNSSLGPEWCPTSDRYPEPREDRRPSELSGESIMRRSSIWVDRDSFPPRMTRSLDIPRSTYQPYQRPVVVMNSPTESSAYNDTDYTDTDDSDYNSAYEDEEEQEQEERSDDDDNDSDTGTIVDANAPWALPPMTLYSPALTRERWISPLGSPAVFSNADSHSPASTPRHNRVSPLPSPNFQHQRQQQHSGSTEFLAPAAYAPRNGSAPSSPHFLSEMHRTASTELLAPTTFTPRKSSSGERSASSSPDSNNNNNRLHHTGSTELLASTAFAPEERSAPSSPGYNARLQHSGSTELLASTAFAPVPRSASSSPAFRLHHTASTGLLASAAFSPDERSAPSSPNLQAETQRPASKEFLRPMTFNPADKKPSHVSSVYSQRQNASSAEYLAPTTYTAGGGKESPGVHYPSWSEVSGFDFVKKNSMDGAGEDGDDGWKPVPDSAAGRYELAT